MNKIVDINILDSEFRVIKVLDDYESLLWNERYNSVGDFSLVVPASSESIQYLAPDNYLQIPGSNRLMIIEHYHPSTDVKDGSKLTYTGRSLESILDRRIIWTQTTISGNLQNGIRKLLNDNAIFQKKSGDTWLNEWNNSPRRISRLRFEESDDPNVTGIIIKDTQFTGDYLLDAISELCAAAGIGFEVRLDEATNCYIFKLYSGKDRSSDQTALPQVEFSLNNDNLISSDLDIDKTNYKNITLIAGEGEGLSRRTATYYDGETEPSDIDRREYFMDARDISSNTGTSSAINATKYASLLQERGKAALKEHEIVSEVDAEVNTDDNSMFTFNKDYFMGDIVDNVDIYGTRFKSRVSEMTTIISSSEISTHPIFTNVD